MAKQALLRPNSITSDLVAKDLKRNGLSSGGASFSVLVDSETAVEEIIKVDVYSDANIDLADLPSTIDDITIEEGMIILAGNQSTTLDNNIYIVNSDNTASPLYTNFDKSFLVAIIQGTVYSGRLTAGYYTDAIYVQGTTQLYFLLITAGDTFPTGTDTQTLRYDGTDLVATSNLSNDGDDVVFTANGDNNFLYAENTNTYAENAITGLITTQTDTSTAVLGVNIGSGNPIGTAGVRGTNNSSGADSAGVVGSNSNNIGVSGAGLIGLQGTSTGTGNIAVLGSGTRAFSAVGTLYNYVVNAGSDNASIDFYSQNAGKTGTNIYVKTTSGENLSGITTTGDNVSVSSTSGICFNGITTNNIVLKASRNSSSGDIANFYSGSGTPNLVSKIKHNGAYEPQSTFTEYGFGAFALDRQHSTALGYNSQVAYRTELARKVGSTLNVPHFRQIYLVGTTTDDSPTVVKINENGIDEDIVLPSNTIWSFTSKIIATIQGGGFAGTTVSFIGSGMIRNASGTMTINSSADEFSYGTGIDAPSFQKNDTEKSLELLVTGNIGDDIEWHCLIDIFEVVKSA